MKNLAVMVCENRHLWNRATVKPEVLKKQLTEITVATVFVEHLHPPLTLTTCKLPSFL